MGDLFDFRNGLSKGKEFFGTGTPFIRYTDVYNNRFLKAENITALVECTPAELEKLRVTRGDVLFTRTSETAEDVGWSAVMLDDMGDCVFNGFSIKEGDIIGLDDKKILAKSQSLEETVLKLINKMKEDFHQVIRLYYGEDVKEEEAAALCEVIAEKYPDCDVDFLNGGQAVYYYIMSLE
jgi:hypothetical protein